jgi:diguanylate cyclase
MKLELFDHNIKYKQTAIAFGLLAIIVLTISMQQFLSGHIETLSINVPAGLLLILLAILRWINKTDNNQDWFSLFGFILIGIILINEIEQLDSAAMAWVYCLPMLLFFSQPLFNAITLSTLLSFGLIISSSEADLLYQQHQMLSGLTFMFLFSGLFAYHQKARSKALFRMAKANPITKLPDFSVFQKQLMEEIERAQASHRPLSIMLIELQDFNKLKELEGKQEIRNIIQKLSKFLDKITRTGDIVYHAEDHQFWVILTNTGKEGALVIDEKVVRMVKYEHWGLISSVQVRATSATLNNNDQQPIHLIERCHRRMASSIDLK